MQVQGGKKRSSLGPLRFLARSVARLMWTPGEPPSLQLPWPGSMCAAYRADSPVAEELCGLLTGILAIPGNSRFGL